MGTQIIVQRYSDISGVLIGEDEEPMQLIVIHPDFGEPITLDAVSDDLTGLPDPQEVVSLTINNQQYLLTIPQFNDLFAGRDAEAILETALTEQKEREQQQEPAPRRGRRTGQRKERVDWSAPERAGLDHPGRVSQAEKLAVQEQGLDEVNRRRINAGQEPFDPDDPAVQSRFGLAPVVE